MIISKVWYNHNEISNNVLKPFHVQRSQLRGYILCKSEKCKIFFLGGGGGVNKKQLTIQYNLHVNFQMMKTFSTEKENELAL